jgi:hypothetical protein
MAEIDTQSLHFAGLSQQQQMQFDKVEISPLDNREQTSELIQMQDSSASVESTVSLIVKQLINDDVWFQWSRLLADGDNHSHPATYTKD